MKFSEKLAAAMREKNISIRELSEKTGIPKSAIQRYTSGDTEKIPIDRMKLMAEALGIDPAYIMGWQQAQETIRNIGEQFTAPSHSSEFRTLSEGLAKMEKENKAKFQALYSFLTTTYPENFSERNDDDDTES